MPDATVDERFAANPLVTEDPRVRFYAGAPLVTSDGHAVGTVCILDRKRRTLTDGQREALMALGRQVVAHLELRRGTYPDRTRAPRARANFLRGTMIEVKQRSLVALQRPARANDLAPRRKH